MTTLRICYVLSYRSPNYIRTRSLLAAIEKIEGVDCFTAVNKSTGLNRYRETLAKVAQIKKQYEPDVYILGFRGYELYWLLRKQVGNKPIVFDAMMSPSVALAEENQFGLAGRLASRFLAPIEKSIMSNANLVLTDTPTHAGLFTERYCLTADKVHAIPVGAVEDAPQAQNVGTNHRLRILFYGSFLPLHGVDTILEACTVLKEMPLDLEFIGTNEAIERKIEQQLGGATQLRYKARRWVDFSDILQSKLPNTDLCLGGPFGNTPQARRVITGKTSQALAQAVPTVVGKIDADIPFQHQVNCLYVSQGNAQALSDAIVWANQNRDKLVDLGLEGRKLYHEQLSLKIVSERLSDLLYQFSG